MIGVAIRPVPSAVSADGCDDRITVEWDRDGADECVLVNV